MLVGLTIKNYALIRELEIRPSAHLNVVTGETGAGKSIMLGAIGLLLGNRADAKALWDENEKCLVEGVFDISAYQLESLFEAADLDYDHQTVIRREINPGGKSRAFINDTPVTLDVMRKIGNRLMIIHSQHETLELGNKNFQLGLIDAYALNVNQWHGYQSAWREFSNAKSDYEKLFTESNQLNEESDFIQFQLEELTKADLQDGEQEKLESELKVLEHAEEIKVQLTGILSQLDKSEFSIRNSLISVRSLLHSISSYSPEYSKLYDRFESLRLELDDLTSEIDREEEHVEVDPHRAQETKDRLSAIYQLLQKHRVQTVGQLIALQKSLQEKFDKIIHFDDALRLAKANREQAETVMVGKASELSKSRQKVFTSLCKQLTQLLKELGIPDAQLKVDHAVVLPNASGSDSIEILFSANKGISPRPLVQVASGGEFSRLMFSIQYVMAEKTALPTLILDEIDSGVSGEIAIQLGKMMKEMAKRHQLIAITHLPQIAAKGDSHYFVYKDNKAPKTISLIRELNQGERVEEIAKMIAGDNPSALALENARELMTH